MGKPDVCEVERRGAKEAILKQYGSVIGENQADNIAYHALLGARVAKIDAERVEAERKRREDYIAEQRFFFQG